MPDYNPDKERHHNHKFIVQQAWPSIVGDEVKTSKGTLRPNDQGRMVVKDETLAREIQQQYPRELTVTRTTADHPSDRGHKFLFGGWPEMPWKRKRQHREAEAQEGQEAQDESPAEATEITEE